MNAKQVADALSNNALNTAEAVDDSTLVLNLRPRNTSRVYKVVLSIESVDEI